MKYILISNGSFDRATAKKIDWSGCKKICVDGGVRHFCDLGIRPDIIIGDLDSADPELIERFESGGVEVLRYPPQKDKTDTEIAIDYGIENGATEMTFLGATGSRMDHTLGSINLLYRLKRLGIESRIVDRYNEIRIISGEYRLEKDENYRYVSLIPYRTDVKGVFLEGFEYELSGRDFSIDDTIGISNEIAGDSAAIKIASGCMILVRSN